MSHHASGNPRLVHPKPRDRATAVCVVHHDRRHKSIESKYGVVGAGAVLTDTTVQTTDTGGDPNNYYPGIVYDPNGLRAYNSGGTLTAEIKAADGSFTVYGSGTITGAVIQTSATNPRTVMNSSGIQSYDNLGNQTFNLGGGQLTIGGQSVITGGTIQTSASAPRVIMDTGGIRAYNSVGANTVNIGSDGSFSLNTPVASITAAGSGVTISSAASTASGARVTIDATGIKGYNASNVQEFLLDSTSGLISATGVITSQPGSTVPWQTTGFYVGGGNLLPNASAEDPTTTSQLVYLVPNAVTINLVEVTTAGVRNGSSGFEVDTQGWGTAVSFRIATGATLTRVNTQAHSGSYSLQVTTTATLNEGADFTPLAVTSGQHYVASVWVKGNAGGEAVQLIVGDGTVGSANASLTCTTAWQRITVAFTPTATGTTGLALRTTTASAVTVFADDVQFEVGTTATTYSSSSFTLKYGTNPTSGPIYANSTVAQVQAALNAAGVLPAGVSATCSAGPLPTYPVGIAFTGFTTPAPSVLSVGSSSLTSGAVVTGGDPSAWQAQFIYSTGVDFIAYSSAFHGGNVFRITPQGPGSVYMGVSSALVFGWTPGSTKYTYSAYFRAPVAARNVQLYVNWYDTNGSQIYQAVSGSSSWTTRSDQWQRLTLTTTVPPATTEQQINIIGSPTGGTWNLVYSGQTTSNLNFNATAAQIQTALNALSSIGANGVTVTGGPLPGTSVYVVFNNPLPTAPAALTFTKALTGGSSPNVVITNYAAYSAIPFVGILNAAAGEVFYVDAQQFETGDVVTAFGPKPDEIVANVITANMVNVGQLSAISADLGTITAGTLNAVTITAAVLQELVGGVTMIQMDPTNGLQLTGGSSTYNNVSWHSGSIAGVVIGEIGAGAFASGGETINQVLLQSFDTAQGLGGKLMIQADVNTGGFVKISCNDDIWGATLMDGVGRSSYAQLTAVRNQRFSAPARAYVGSVTNLSAAGWTNLSTWTSTTWAVDFDPESAFSGGSYVCQTSGYYWVNGQVCIANTTTLAAAIYTNGSSFQRRGDTSSSGTCSNVCGVIYCTAGTSIQLGAYGQVGLNLTSTYNSWDSNYLEVMRIM